ncbi:MAG: efflux RND transporter periplasmic adaptor subunit [Candidatus Peregrinibacteria bacterium]
MKRLILFLVIIGLALTGYYYRSEIVDFFTKTGVDKTDNTVVQKIPRELPAKEVEVFDLKTDKAELTFTKSGVSYAKTRVSVISQTSGKITEIMVKVGDKVSSGDTLAKLSDSLSTNIAEIQLESAKQGLKVLRSTENLTAQSVNNTIASAQLGTELAAQAYENAQKSRNNTENLFNGQLKAAELGVETTEKAYKSAKKNYDKARDELDEIEDEINDLEDLPDEDGNNSDIISQLENAKSAAKAQVDAAKFAKENASLALDQAENSLSQLKKSLASQKDSLDYAVNAALLQYQSALKQLQSAQTGGELQLTGLQGQIVQSQSAVQTAELNADSSRIKAPIAGVITEISAKEGNFTSPGQILAKIQNINGLEVKTSVNENEVQLISVGDNVYVKGETSDIKGKITSISPSVNETSRKINVEISLPASPDLTAGSFVKITFSPIPKSKIFIPLNSIHLDNGKKLVKIVNQQSRIELKEILTGQIIGDYIEVTGGLDGNEKIITTTSLFLEEGEKVTF